MISTSNIFWILFLISWTHKAIQCQNCRGRGDISIVLDGSSSIDDTGYGGTPGNFRKLTALVANFIAGLDFEHHRVGLVVFANSAFSEFDLSNTLTKAEKINKANTARYPKGATQTGKGMKLGTDMLVDKNLPVIKSRPKVEIVITDGASTDKNDLLRSIARTVELGISTIGVGVGEGFNDTELLQIAQGKQENVVAEKGFENIDSIFAVLKSVTCKIPYTPKVNETVEDDVDKDNALYFCYVNKPPGITITMDRVSGLISAYYSFTSKNPTDKENDGKFDDDEGARYFPYGAKQKQICVAIIGKGKSNKFKITYVYGKLDPGPFNELGMELFGFR